MTDRKTRGQTYQQPAGPADPERMRDPDYVVRGYKAALYRRNSDKDRDRPPPRVVLAGQPYVAEGARGGILTQEVRERIGTHASSAPKDKKPEKVVEEGEETAAVAKDE